MTDLSDKMRELAVKMPDHAWRLFSAAYDFDEAAEGFYDKNQTVSVKEFLGAWARARKLYCECSGEPLI